ncbi:GTPase ObgE [Staphylococcus sp. SQ8-PEA]|uniref:GTPase Obg n=1 Tax=Staphylococcus marylandisciuri TaxID=2981529 RepID=A0ABT2QQ01_9STAP|nr:GTPase ObgE [Staphylococcus marylandisciuri]MCU5746056.1 GTPase ObgE [Staphylococcus marylandisciuri]
MFVDQVSIKLKAGDGGNGITAYRREKYVPFGGPAGGDGGSGASIVFEVDEGLRTLLDFRYQRHFKAKKGENGQSSNMHGKNAEDLILHVPPGTIIKDIDGEEVLADLVEHGQRATIAKGGRGGRGNSKFASARNPAPDFSENGEPGEEIEVTLELKMLADVGLVGYPSVGKSTLLSVVSKAKPKVGAYHFTTIKPNLGMVSTPDQRSFVMADLPGLIEGASEGVGLGYQFLRHVERTRVIVHVIDMSASEGRDPYEDFKVINKELKAYEQKLEERPQIVAANKMDLPEAEDELQLFKEQLQDDGYDDIEIIPISTYQHMNIDKLLYTIGNKLEEVKDVDFYNSKEDVGVHRVLYKHTPSQDHFTITRADDGAYVVQGNAIERTFKMTDFNSDPAVRRFARQMRSMGIDDALRERGCSNGDIVRILGGEFEFIE